MASSNPNPRGNVHANNPGRERERPQSRRNNNLSVRMKHDKTRYTILPTPPSPTQSSPSLTQSTSVSPPSLSGSSSSPPQPYTPPRGRSSSRGRYPSLGHVPLHRRGTSKTYERLEDLLREAGYKETRIFTPESERSGDEDGKTESRLREGVGAVVGFLAGLIPGAGVAGGKAEAENVEAPAATVSMPDQMPKYSPPPSPTPSSVHRTRKQTASPAPITLTASNQPPSSMSSSVESLGRVISSSMYTAPLPRHPQPGRSNSSPLSHSHVSQSQTQTTFPTQPYTHSTRPLHQPQPTRASAYLRHMASVPNFPRPSSSASTRLHSNHTGLRRSMTRNEDGVERRVRTTSVYSRPSRALLLNESNPELNRPREIEDPKPPLPRTWLENVARAVLFGGTGAYIGGPSSTSVSPSTSTDSTVTIRAPVLRHAPSGLSQLSNASSSRPNSKSRSYTPSTLGRHGRFRPPSVRAHSALADYTNMTPSSSKPHLPLPLPKQHNTSNHLLQPIPVYAKIQMQKVGVLEGEVSKARVVCRSAPVSRAGSRVRGGMDGGENGSRHLDPHSELMMYLDGDRRGREWEKKKKTTKMKKERKGDKDGVPSLAKTVVEGDAWVEAQNRTRQSRGKERSSGGGGNRYLSGWGADGVDDDDAEVSSSSEEEGELDLARMLVPPKRQNSIKSLRRHLQGGALSMTVASGSVPKGRRRESTDDLYGSDGDCDGEREDWGKGWTRRRFGGRRGSTEDVDDDEDYRVSAIFRQETRAGGNGRRGFPAWAQLTGS